MAIPMIASSHFRLGAGRALRWLATALLLLRPASAAVRDLPFRQAVSVRFANQPEVQGAQFSRLALNRDGIAYLLTDKGVARLFDHQVGLDRSFRPLIGLVAHDIALQRGELFYLFDDALLSNGGAGRYYLSLPTGTYQKFAVSLNGTALLLGLTNLLLVAGNQSTNLALPPGRPPDRLYAWGDQFYVLTSDAVYRVGKPQLEMFHQGKELTTLGFRGTEVFVGTRRGYYVVDLQTAKVISPLQDKLPAVEITALAPTTNGLWAGTTRGVFFQGGPKWIRYYASQRWLDDDYVLDLQVDPAGDLFVLTRSGLNKVEFQSFTLAHKASYYEAKIRQRHIRYGFCSELRLTRSGDPTSAEMIDTDNDGTWSSLYLASQAFKYAVTGDESARTHAWETFDALERLQSIHTVEGFPARTFERTGFKFSDPDRWRPSPETNWEWKGHTSSDEITAHTFAYAVLYEVATRTPAEKARIASLYERIINHILRNNYYLVDVDGQPTLWGRWNPEYVNQYPPTIVDRRLNSSEIVAFLQFAHRVTGKPVYREKAHELLERHGYLRNITNSMAMIRSTPGFIFRGNDMGNEWNHSDDQLAFLNYWTLYRTALTDEHRRAYAAAIRDHWELEKLERNPLWNFICAMTGAPVFDPEGAIWTLQNFPLDLVAWSIQNSHRKDLTRLPANFRQQETVELLPPDERPTMRWNGNPFALDGGAGGAIELAGDEFLLPYWMGRYLRIIQ